MGGKQRRGCPTSSAIRKTQMKATVRYHSSEWLKCKKIFKKCQMLEGMWGEQSSPTQLAGMQNNTALWRRVCQFLVKLNIYLSYDPGIPLLNIFSREIKHMWPHRNLHMNVHSNFKQESNKLKQPIQHVAAAAAKSLQSCPTLCNPRRQPTRLPRPWDSPGKNTGVGCHFLLQCMKVKSQSEVSQQPHTLQPSRLLHPWDFPGKSTRVGCHCQ